MSLLETLMASKTQKKPKARKLNEEEVYAIDWQARMLARAEYTLKNHKVNVAAEHTKNKAELLEQYANSPKSAMRNLMIDYDASLKSSKAVAFEKRYVDGIVEQEQTRQKEEQAEKSRPLWRRVLSLGR